MQYTHSYFHNKIHWLTLMPVLLFVLVSCSSSDAEEISETPSLSDIPVSFQAASKWDNASSSRVKENGNAVSFEGGDAIGVFAYYNKENGTPSTAPNFMNNQKVTCDVQDNTTSWTYSPVKYWPNNPQDNISFYAYYPYRDGEHYDFTATSSDGAPVIKYNYKNADVDLMGTEKSLGKDGNVSFLFKHLLAKMKFTFSSVGNNRPVIHALKYDIPYEGDYDFNSTNSDNKWTVQSTRCELLRLVENKDGEVIDKANVTIDDFTSYLLPCTISQMSLSVNNIFVDIKMTPAIEIKSGKQYTLNFVLSGTDGSYVFITSYSLWESDEKTYEGKLK